MDAASPSPAAFWKKCSVCKRPIGFRAPYYVCSVSSCNGQRTGYVFCKIDCFESHIPGARHKSAGALDKVSPSQAEAAREAESSVTAPAAAASTTSPSSSLADQRAPQRVMVRPGGAAHTPSNNQMPREVLVIASRLKDYITARSDFNTSQSVMDVLSDHLRILCDRAIDEARAEGRKTVMDRDFSFLKK